MTGKSMIMKKTLTLVCVCAFACPFYSLHLWCAGGRYTSAMEGRKVFLPNEAVNATILASRVNARAFEHLASVVRSNRRDLKLLFVAQGLESRARNLLKGKSKKENERERGGFFLFASSIGHKPCRRFCKVIGNHPSHQ